MVSEYSLNMPPLYPAYIQPQNIKVNSNIVNNTQNGIVYTNAVYYTPPYGIQQNNYIKIGVQKAPNGQEFHIYQLKTGQKIAIAKGSGTPIIKTRVDVGAFDESPDKTGISHLIEHSMFHGSKKYGNTLEQQVEEIGVVKNAATSKYFTDYYFKLDNQNIDNLKKAIDMQADMILNPTFSQLEKELAIVKKESDEDCAVETNLLCDSVTKNLYSLNDTKSKSLITGDSSTLDSITRDDILNYYSTYYRPDNMATVVISNVEPDELIKCVSESFSKASEGKNYSSVIEHKSLTPTETIKRVDYISKDDAKGNVSFSFSVPNSISEQDKTNLMALLALLLMRSDFFGTFSKENSQYSSVEMTAYNLKDSNENDRLIQLQRELNNVILSPPTEQELKRIKNQLLEDVDYGFLNNEKSATSVLSELISKKNINLLGEKNAVSNITANGIVGALKYINLNKLSMGVLHPTGTSVEDINKKYNEAYSSVSAVILPKRTENINISNMAKSYDLEPYTSQPVKNALLPNNTNLIATESKSDKCNVTWELYNPNITSVNPALKLVLNKLFALLPYETKAKMEETGSSILSEFGVKTFKIEAECPSSELAEIIKNMKLMFDIYFGGAAFKSAKEEVLDEIVAMEESAYDKRFKDINGLMYSENVGEIKAELEKLTLNDLKVYFNELINNSYSTAVVSAPFSKNSELLNSVASSINVPDFTFKKPDEGLFENKYIQKTSSNCYIAEEKALTPLYGQIYSFKTSGNQEDSLKLKLLFYVMYTRLYNDLREKQGLCYTPSSDYSSNGNSGEITLYVTSSSTSQDEIKKIFDGFKNNVNRLKTENITEEELNHAKSEMRIQVLELFDNTQALHSNILEIAKEPMGLSAMQNVVDIIDKITVDDIRMAANYAFREKPDYLIDADKGTLEANKDYFASLGNIK